MELARTYARHWKLWEGQLEKKGSSDRTLVEAYNGIAWICATSRIRAFRDPEKALSYARKAVELAGKDEGRAPVLDTLAEAYFATGDVGRAVYTIQVAIDVLECRLARRTSITIFCRSGSSSTRGAGWRPRAAGETKDDRDAAGSRGSP